MENVSKMIEALDEAAKPVSDVKIVTLQGNVNAERVREVLADVLGKGGVVSSGPGESPRPPPPGMPPGASGPMPNGGRR
jgi:hypothetical protein